MTNSNFKTKYLIYSVSFILLNSYCFKAQNNRLWATYYGGATNDVGQSVATDGAGNVYIAGQMGNTAGLSTAGAHQTTFGGGSFDGMLVKFNSAGVRQWATYYGGAGSEYNMHVAVDASNNVYLAGSTQSTAGIASGGHQLVYGGGFTDAFLVKFNSAGVRQWSTYYGGSGNEGAGSGLGEKIIAIDGGGNVYLTGLTKSATGIFFGTGYLNTYVGPFDNDAYLVKFDAAGVRQWGTYYGGAGDENGMSVGTDILGNVYIGGSTKSSSNIAVGGYQNTYGGVEDNFLVKFNATTCALVWATYYGGPAQDFGGSMAIDGSGNIYLTGITNSASGIFLAGGFQNTYGGSSDAYLVKFNSAGTPLWATYYGGAALEHAYGSAVDPSGNIYMAGLANSSGLSAGGFQGAIAGGEESFLIKIDPSGGGYCATYYGGTLSDYGQAVASDPTGNIYMAGHTQSTAGIASGGHDNTFGGGVSVRDFYLVKFTSCSVVLPIELTSFTGSNQGTANLLQWTTASELNNDYFTIERSINGVLFESLGNIKGSANSSVIKKYEFNDSQLPKGEEILYYRLKQTDYDGQYEYSDIISIAKKTEYLQINAYPNPAINYLTLDFNSELNAIQTIEIKDITGKTIKIWQKEIGKGVTNFNLDVNDLPEGMYFLKLMSAEKNDREDAQYIKFAKQ